MILRFFAKILPLAAALWGGGAGALGQGQPGGPRHSPPVHGHPPARRSRNAAAHPPPAAAPVAALAGPAFCPPVALLALNRAYVRELVYRRQLHAPRLAGQLPVQFDSLLLPGTVLHNQRLTGVAEHIFHDLHQHHAELVGFSGNMQQFRNQPDRLAHYIWRLFNESKTGHKEIQQNHALAFVSVSCSAAHFVVRLDYSPTVPTAAEVASYAQWRAQSGGNCAAGGAISLGK